MRVTANFNLSILNLSSLVGNIQANISKSLNESASFMKTSLVQEFKARNKVGEVNLNNQYARRRSARGQSLAKDSGRALELIQSDKTGNRIVAGVKDNANYKGGNYVASWENNGRQTLEPTKSKVLPEVQRIFENNLKPRG